MTQDEKEKREDIRHKTADAIMLIEQFMEIRRQLPKDEHNMCGMKETARAIGDRFTHEMNNADFDPVAVLLDEAKKVDEYELSDKARAEARFAIECVAKAFGVQHQYIARSSAIAQAKAAQEQDNNPPQQRRAQR